MGSPYYIRKHLHQTMIYWGNPKNDGEGTYTFDAPIEIRGRCEYRTELVRTETGEEKVSRARVYLEQEVDQGGYLYLGSLEDSDVPPYPNPEEMDEAMRILSLDIFPRITGPGFLYKAFVNANKYGNN